MTVVNNCVTANNFTSPSTANCSVISANTVLISNLTTAAVSPSIYSISIGTVTNANKALTTSSFSLIIYYSDDRSAQVGTSTVTGVTMLPRPLINSSISVLLTDYTVSASLVTMNVSFVALDKANGYITITIPP